MQWLVSGAHKYYMQSLTFSHSCGTRRPQLLLAAGAEHPDATRDLENGSLVAPSCSAFSFRFVFWSVPMLECSQSVCVCVCFFGKGYGNPSQLDS